MKNDIGGEHRKGEHVLYKNCGIFQITDIRSEGFGGEDMEYYVLRSVCDERSVVYVPVGSPLADQMRHMLSHEEIDAVIRSVGNSDTGWVADSKARAHQFAEILGGGDRTEILRLVKTLTLYKLELAAQKKKLYIGDERALSSAEKIIAEEFSFVLGIGKSEVVPYIISRSGGTLPARSS